MPKYGMHLSIEIDVYERFKEECESVGVDMSTVVELFMRAILGWPLSNGKGFDYVVGFSEMVKLFRDKKKGK